ncbi:hypothetical protein [Jiangella alkaliphila]|uniref:hypothetical protein n=1 Tax=Jiangella alkaliphila TaxID=419479 RepID=UPI0012FC6324|nr:hypothetical protein [Jiangella alkaliphila]
MTARILSCDSCRATTVDDCMAGAWFVFHDGDGPGNARCPDCLPEQARRGGDLACLL